MFKKSVIGLLAGIFSIGAFATSAPIAASAASVATSSPGIFAALFGFITGLLLNWPALTIIAIIGVFCEANSEHGMALFFGIVLALISYFFFNVSFMHLVYGTLVYLVIGLVWSFYRYKRHGAKLVEKFKNESHAIRVHALEEFHPTRMIGSITIWILAWPFSFIENFFGDIINTIQTVVIKFFRGVYHRIFNNVASDLGLDE